MKKIVAVLGLFLCIALFSACNRSEPPAPGALDRDTSYAFGMVFAGMAAEMGLVGLSFDYNAFMEGFRDFTEARETRLTNEAAMERVAAVFTGLQGGAAQRNLEEGQAYLAQNALRPGVVTTASGLQYEVIVQGTGERPGPADVVRVHYEGSFLDGTLFDSSFQLGEPVEFPVGMVIDGWVEGLQLMNVGSTYRFVIPSDLAYGPHGFRMVPPNATLIFTIELIDIVR